MDRVSGGTESVMWCISRKDRQTLGDKLTATEGCFDVLVEMVAVSPPGMSVGYIYPFLAEWGL